MEITLPYEQYLSIYRYKYLALYHALRAVILSGTLQGGTRLPATRQMAVLYGLSRGSVSQVYEMLMADGYIQGETGRGTFVSHNILPDAGREAAAVSESVSKQPVWGEREGQTSQAADAPADHGRLQSNKAGKDTEILIPVLKTGRPGLVWASEVASSAGSADTPDEKGRDAHVHADATLMLSAWGRRLIAAPARIYEDWTGQVIPFLSGGMQMAHFPYTEWRSALSYAGGKGGALMAHSGPPQGDEGLRRAIAAHLRITRGIRAEAGQIVLFSGSMQGIVLLTQLLLDPGQPAVLENPGFHGIRRAIEMTGGIPLNGVVDENGLVPEDWDARLLFVTPSRQFPTGAVLPLERRRALLNWAHRHNAVIIEDDYDSEFRWTGRPIEPLKALDREDRVVHIGSFSNTMFAGLRLGYAVLPQNLAGPAAAAKALYEPLPAGLLEQRALARFMNTGGYRRHLRRMTRIYGERGRAFRALLAGRLSGLFQPLPGDAGLQVYARWLRSPAEYAAFQAAALRRGASFRDAALYWGRPGEPAACFHFSHLTLEEMEEGVRRLLLAWADVQNGT